MNSLLSIALLSDLNLWSILLAVGGLLDTLELELSFSPESSSLLESPTSFEHFVCFIDCVKDDFELDWLGAAEGGGGAAKLAYSGVNGGRDLDAVGDPVSEWECHFRELYKSSNACNKQFIGSSMYIYTNYVILPKEWTLQIFCHVVEAFLVIHLEQDIFHALNLLLLLQLKF